MASNKPCWGDHFDKILAAGFLLLFSVMIVLFVLIKADGKAFDWAKEAFSYFMGILSTLITGRALLKSQAPPPDPPPADPPKA